MPQINYKCNQCNKNFLIKYMFLKPSEITCPHCGSTNVKVQADSQCGCSGDKKGFFT